MKGIYIFVYRGLSPKLVVISGLELLLLREELLSPEAKRSQISFFVFHFAEECVFFFFLSTFNCGYNSLTVLVP